MQPRYGGGSTSPFALQTEGSSASLLPHSGSTSYVHDKADPVSPSAGAAAAAQGLRERSDVIGGASGRRGVQQTPAGGPGDKSGCFDQDADWGFTDGDGDTKGGKLREAGYKQPLKESDQGELPGHNWCDQKGKGEGGGSERQQAATGSSEMVQKQLPAATLLAIWKVLTNYIQVRHLQTPPCFIAVDLSCTTPTH